MEVCSGNNHESNPGPSRGDRDATRVQISVAQGASCALISPVGALAIDPPREDGLWTMDGAYPLRRAQLNFPGSVFFLNGVVYGFVLSSVTLSGDLGRPLSDVAFFGVQVLLSITNLSLCYPRSWIRHFCQDLQMPLFKVHILVRS